MTPGLKDTLEEEMATYSSILAWIIPWTEDTVHGVVVSDTTAPPRLPGPSALTTPSPHLIMEIT